MTTTKIRECASHGCHEPALPGIGLCSQCRATGGVRETCDKMPAFPPDNPPPRRAMTAQNDKTPKPTRTVYQLAVELLDGILSEDTRSTCYLTTELAKHQVEAFKYRAALRSGEHVVLVRIDQRLGGDGAWHSANETIMEVL